MQTGEIGDEERSECFVQQYGKQELLKHLEFTTNYVYLTKMTTFGGLDGHLHHVVQLQRA